MVDDRSENLLALEAILDCLNENLVKAESGSFEMSFHQDFAVILLDNPHAGSRWFETAALIRKRLRSPPIIS